MSENDSGDDIQHEIESWENDTCSHLMPYWREVFQNHNASENYVNIHTPRYLAVKSCTVELIIQICEMLKQALPVIFLTVDIFDNFLANHVSDMWKSFDKLHTKNSENEKIEFKTYWCFMSSHLEKQLLLRLLSCMQLASKMTFSPNRMTSNDAQDILKHCKQDYSIKDIVKSEFRVFRTLNFRLPTNTSLECLELLIQQCCAPEHHSMLHETSVEVLKFCYTKDSILQSFLDDDHPSLMSACSLIVSSHLYRMKSTKALCLSVSKVTGIPANMLKSRSNNLLKTVLC